MVLAGCWPNNALGEAKLGYCFCAGHLLDSAFVLQLQPRYLCVLESASVPSWALNRFFFFFYKCTHNNVSGISHSPSIYAQKTWRSFPYEWEFMRCSSRGQRIVFRLPPYDTPRAARCNKAKFRVHRRHAAGGVCEQRVTALRKYIYRYIQTHPLYYSYMWGSLRLAPIKGGRVVAFGRNWVLDRGET